MTKYKPTYEDLENQIKILESELIIANKEPVFQNKEKGKRAAELIIANKELAFQNEEKGKGQLNFSDQSFFMYLKMIIFTSINEKNFVKKLKIIIAFNRILLSKSTIFQYFHRILSRTPRESVVVALLVERVLVEPRYQ